MNRQRISLVVIWFGVSALFVISSAAAVFWTAGYRINLQTWRIQKTGLIYLKSDPKEVTVLINNRLVSFKTPFRWSRILPGVYELAITKDGFLPWRKTIRVEPDLTSDYRTIILYKDQAVEAEPTEDQTKYLKNYQFDQDVTTSDGEIWYNTQLVSRFSSPIIQADLTPDRDHIVYQRGREIRVIEIDGGNDSFLVGLAGSEKVPFAMIDDGRSLVVGSNDQVKKYIIR